MNNNESALSGIRVLDLSNETGVYCGKLLADMGADVIRVEHPEGDPIRMIPPFLNNKKTPDKGLYYLYTNTSKRGITLNIEEDEGHKLFKLLIQKADMVIETHQPGYLDAFGIGYRDLRANKKSIIVTSITGFGQDGPYKHYKCSDIVASALGGSMYTTGEAEDPPVMLAGFQSYIMASSYAAASSLIALYSRFLTGEGQHIDISLEEVMVSVTHISGVPKWLDDNIIPRRRGTGLFAAVPSGAYQCKDGLIYIMVNRPHHWKALASWINETTGNTDILDAMFEGPSYNRQEYRELLDVYINDHTSGFTVEEIYHEGQRRHLAFTSMSTAKAVAEDKHLNARDYFVEVEHSNQENLRYPGAPYRHSETPWRICRLAPAIGEHNKEIYCAELGLSEEELGNYITRGII